MQDHPVPLKIDLTPNWAITLNQQFTQRYVDETLNLFNQSIGLWIRCYTVESGPNILERMERDAAAAPANATDQTKGIQGGLGRVSYIVPADDAATPPEPAKFYTHTHASDSELMIVFMLKAEGSLTAAKEMYESLAYTETLAV